ncbi:hypothetical protein SpCBS45565_g04079 [Spizellomyces sp. 'palustris']|nr:hypothetical protein SpCBS45565_g04079 [Spizellomyces sp. 'palustris']
MSQVYPRESRLIVLEPGSFQTKAGYVDQATLSVVNVPSIAGAKVRRRQQNTAESLLADSISAKITEDAVKEEQKPEDTTTPMEIQEPPSSAASVAETGVDGSNEAEEEEEFETVYVAGASLATEQTEPKDTPEWKVVKPIRNGLVEDWDALSGLWQHILLRELPTAMKRSRNDWSVMLTVPMSWSKEDHKRATKIMFEDMNILAFSIIEQPLAALYGGNVTTGLVIDIGHETTDVTPIIDNIIIRHAYKTIPLGGRDIEHRMAQLLREDATSMAELGDIGLNEDIVRIIKESGACEVKPGSGWSADGEEQRVTLEVKGKQISIGSARYRSTDILFDPIAAGKHTLSIQEACYLAVTEACEPERRTSLWDNLMLTGGCSLLKGMKQRLEVEIGSLIAASETSNEFQAKDIKWVNMPDYFTAYKDRLQDASYVGASVVAKIIFLGSSFGYLTKADYNEIGPAAIYLKA